MGALGRDAADGGALPRTAVGASLLLPMGRDGPAFLAYPNFQVFLEWNQSLVYSTTAAYFATRIAGAPRAASRRPAGGIRRSPRARRCRRRSPSAATTSARSDGIIGLQTRAAVKAVQLKLGLPADSYPTKELLAKLKAG